MLAPRSAARASRPAPLLAVALAGVLLAAALALPAAAPAKTTWLCKPGMKDDPCRTSLTTTLVAPDGRITGTERLRNARRPKVDCFYVYPTVSDQTTANATLRIDPEQRAIARFQASRFSSLCRVYAPMYRQITLRALGTPSLITPQVQQTAFADVRAAWREYLRRYNRGRGVILVGHSQGTFMLRTLAAQEIDPKAAERRRLVGAYLIGGNVTVAKGSDRGGDFRRIRACRRATQTGCVVAYSLFNGPVPATARFGRPTGADAADREVLCTNPAALGGGRGAFRSRTPTSTFPGTIGLGVSLVQGQFPRVPAPWVGSDTSYSGRCVSEGGASVLQVTSAPGAPFLRATPDAGWGLHLTDVNLPLGNLLTLARRQAAAWEAKRR